MKPTKEVKKAVDVWINKDGIQYEDDGQDMQVAHTRKEVMDNYFRLRIELEELEDLAQFIWDTALHKGMIDSANMIKSNIETNKKYHYLVKEQIERAVKEAYEKGRLSMKKDTQGWVQYSEAEDKIKEARTQTAKEIFSYFDKYFNEDCKDYNKNCPDCQYKKFKAKYK